MLRLFLWVLRTVLRIGGQRVVAAFEWPRGASGWQLDVCKELIEMLPITCRFDGCRYGLVSEQGYIKKPWRVQTNRIELEGPLSQRCEGGHRHDAAWRHGSAIGSLHGEVGEDHRQDDLEDRRQKDGGGARRC